MTLCPFLLRIYKFPDTTLVVKSNFPSRTKEGQTTSSLTVSPSTVVTSVTTIIKFGMLVLGCY